jgi:hypothetical protein
LFLRKLCIIRQCFESVHAIFYASVCYVIRNKLITRKLIFFRRLSIPKYNNKSLHQRSYIIQDGRYTPLLILQIVCRKSCVAHSTFFFSFFLETISSTYTRCCPLSYRTCTVCVCYSNSCHTITKTDVPVSSVRQTASVRSRKITELVKNVHIHKWCFFFLFFFVSLQITLTK